MQEQIRQLIDRVESFEIDPGDKALDFARRLARENRWSVAYSERVIREYKRFCILAISSGHHVTPSEAVDQAWHLHLTYTRSYWERFCGEALGQPLHHEPTSGGSSEGAKFHDWYSETLSSYVRLFGEEPPQDVWPEPKKRFSHAGEWKWVNVGHYWLVPRIYLWPLAVALLLMVFTILPGCAPTLVSLERPGMLVPILAVDIFPFSLSGSDFLRFYGVLCAIGLAAVIILRTLLKPAENERESQLPELSVDELAVLSGGGIRLAHVALTRLYAGEYIEVKQAGWFSRGKFVAKPNKEPITSNIDRDLYTEIQKGTATNQLPRAIKPHYDRINAKLNDLNLRDVSNFHSKTAMVIVGTILALGVLRLFQGILNGQEVGFLFLIMFLFTVVALLSNVRTAKVTEEGSAYLARSKVNLTSQPRAADTTTSSTNDLVFMNVALLGTSAIAGFDGFGPLLPVMQNLSNNSGSGAGCGAGCGSGCGGGGCGGGGCGGCGG